MIDVKIIDETNDEIFKAELIEALEDGYEILNISSTVVQSEKYDFCSVYQAILLKR